ncbi:AEC family transporter [Peptoniphilus sp.]|jgi:predicted permease|uniref:AEC family transporter n=1 Tax=Peptoniphilus sp. TaxID=1971214 RepID=UPI003D8AB9D5
MESLFLGFNIVFPIFFVLAIGYIAKERGYIDSNFVDKGTWLVFYIALPFKLFYDIKNADIKSLHPKYVIYILSGVIIVTVISWIIGKLIIKDDNKKLSAFIHCSYRSNFVYVGFPILDMIYNGTQSLEHIIVIVAFGLTLYNIVAIVVLTYYGESENKRINIVDILIKIIKNPMIIGIILGSLFNFLNIPVYSGIERSIEMISKLSTPLSLILIGASLKFEGASKDSRAILTSALIKTVLSPLVMVPIGILLGFSNMELGIAYVFWATPCAVNCFVFTKQMDSDYQLASKVITFSFALSILTFPIGISLMNYFNLLY